MYVPKNEIIQGALDEWEGLIGNHRLKMNQGAEVSVLERERERESERVDEREREAERERGRERS